MRTAADQITVRKFFELVVGTHEKHLIPTVRHVEGGAEKDRVILLPIFRCDHQLATYVRRDISIRRALAKGAEDVVAALLLVFLPANTADVVGHRSEDVERKVTSGRSGWIRLPGVADVKRHILEGRFAARDALDVFLVLARENDHVVLGVIYAIEAEVHHECRAGKFSLAKGRWLVASETLFLKECAHGMAEVGVDHDIIGVDLFTAGQFDPAGAAAIQEYAGHRAGSVDLGAFGTGDLGEGMTDSTKTAHNVVHAVGVFCVRDHREETGTIPR